MSKRELIKNKYGFTLAELLVVVAIIVILVAISIPIFTSQLEKARASTCDANRRSLKAEMTVDYQSGKEFSNGMITEDTLRSEYGNNFDFDTFCPSHGKITAEFDGTSFTVFCSEHRPSNLGSKTALEKLFGVFSDIGGSLNTIDSGAISDSSSFALRISDELKKAGFDMDKMGAVSWQYSSGNQNNPKGFFYWSQQDISQLNAGDKIPVLRYNRTSGTYTVWQATIKQTTRQGGNGTYYNSFSNYTINSQSKVQSQADQTYENALEIYNQALN